MSFQLVPPGVQPPLDENFRPAILANQNFQRQVESIDTRLVLGLERSGSEFSRFEVDESNGLSYVMDMSALLSDATKDPAVFAQDVDDRIRWMN